MRAGYHWVMHSFSTVFWSVAISLIFCSTAVASNKLLQPVPITPVAGYSEVHPDPNVLVYWNGSSKFGGVLVKRGAHWYASFGLIVGLVDFLVQEAHVREGAIVFLHEGFDDFHTRSRVLDMARFFSIAGNFRFYSCMEDDCPKPAYRQYFDTNNRKIDYPDAPR